MAGGHLGLDRRNADDGGSRHLDAVTGRAIYTYLDVICWWNLPPLVDQRWSGFVMFVAGVPVQLVGVWLLIGSFIGSNPAAKSPAPHSNGGTDCHSV